MISEVKFLEYGVHGVHCDINTETPCTLYSSRFNIILNNILDIAFNESV